MQTPRVQLVLNGAPSRYDRALQGLGRDYARVDGRTFEELLSFAVRYAALINFYDLRNEVHGDWVPFFLYDPTMVLATLASFDASAAAEAFESETRRTRGARGLERKRRALRDSFRVIQGLARLVDGALAGLIGAGAASALLRDEIETAVEGELGTRLRELRAYDEGAALPRALGQAVGLDWSGFLPLWALDNVRPDGSIYSGRTPERRADRAVSHLRPLFEAFETALTGWSESARRGLAATLEQNDHKPQVALFMAFARLFRRAQRTLDTYSRRYTRFYRNDVLRAARRGPVPDTAWLTFTMASEEGVAATSVPAGTLFSAGQDAEGRAIVYAADRAVGVTPATLARVHMLRPSLGALYDPAEAVAPPSGDAPVVRELWASTVALAGEGESQDDTTRGWPTFGSDAAGEDGREVTLPATMGFALGSSCLYLSGGTRTVTLTLMFAPGAARDALNARLNAIAAVTGLTPDQVLRSVSASSWRLDLSTREGWFEVESYSCPPPGSDDAQVTQLLLRFTLTAGAPAVEPLDPEALADATGEAAVDPAPGLPTLKAYLDQASVSVAGPAGTVLVPPLTLLGSIELASIGVAVSVAALSGATVETTDGEVDTSAPFAVFGAAPVVGSYLRVRHAELFIKQPTSVTLDVKWFSLPTGATGFKGYYRDYTLGTDGGPLVPLYDNSVFTGQLGVRSPGAWTLGQDAQPGGDKDPGVAVSLFRTLDGTDPSRCVPTSPAPDGELCPFTVFGPYTPAPHDTPSYYRPEDSALQLELRAPRNGFGDDLYSINVLNSIIQDLPELTPGGGGTDPAGELQYPNPPWLPQAESVSVSYGAAARIGESASERFFHLTPFEGYAEVALAAQSPPLLPMGDTEADGRLLLGFTALLPPQTLTLFFQLASQGDQPAPEELPPVDWEYLAGDAWTSLLPGQVPSDATGGLQNTGIVALALPRFEAALHTRLPAGYAWLSARVEEHAGAFPRTLALLPHATTASWVDDGNGGAHLREPLPAHTITASVEELPYIATIDQPVASVGGRPREDARAFGLRVAERLRHKERALLSWDYERLVMERFPAVWQVQALPAHDRTRSGVPGHVLLMVVPGSDAAPGLDRTAPAAPPEMLARIRDELRALTSLFVQLDVVNPVYVRVKVRAEVELRAGEETGAALDQLDADLVSYLSPWFYDVERAAKGGNYASEDEITEFVQTRPYVAALRSIEFAYTPRPETLAGDWYFLTSAEAHDLSAASGGSACDDTAR